MLVFCILITVFQKKESNKQNKKQTNRDKRTVLIRCNRIYVFVIIAFIWMVQVTNGFLH